MFFSFRKAISCNLGMAFFFSGLAYLRIYKFQPDLVTKDLLSLYTRILFCTVRSLLINIYFLHILIHKKVFINKKIQFSNQIIFHKKNHPRNSGDGFLNFRLSLPAYLFFAISSSFRILLSIFPTFDFGRLSLNSTNLGTL